jgi:hypothetical protein
MVNITLQTINTLLFCSTPKTWVFAANVPPNPLSLWCVKIIKVVSSFSIQPTFPLTRQHTSSRYSRTRCASHHVLNIVKCQNHTNGRSVEGWNRYTSFFSSSSLSLPQLSCHHSIFIVSILSQLQNGNGWWASFRAHDPPQVLYYHGSINWCLQLE